MAKVGVINNRHGDAPSELAKNCNKRAKSFLSGWIENSLIVSPPPQSKRLFSRSMRRRSLTESINSLADSLQSIMLDEHQNQDYPTQDESSANKPNVSQTYAAAPSSSRLSLSHADPCSSLHIHSNSGVEQSRRSCNDAKKHGTLSDNSKLDLGDTFLFPKHQIIEPNPAKAVHLVQQLHIHDFAWVRRSSNEWTYGIVADFPEPKHGEEASILFVIDKLGHTKTFKMKYWATCIRLVDDTVIYC